MFVHQQRMMQCLFIRMQNFDPMFKYINLYNFVGTIVSLLALFYILTCYFAPSTNFLFNVAVLQSFYLLELVNILLRMSKSRIFPTSLQLASRLFVSWFICYFYNNNNNTAYVMLFCWFFADSIRYLFYFSRNRILKFLRYNVFIVLYPLGTFCEIVLMSKVEKKSPDLLKYILRAIMLCYLPGFCFLYVHMIKRRRWTAKKNIINKKKEQ